NEHSAVEAVARTIESGEAVALVSDAGTPGISDPGFLLVRTCLEHGIEIETLPGATAFVPALVDSGFPCDRFCFEGFLPAKKGRTKRLLQLADEERTMIFYESPYRLTKTLEQFAGVFGAERPVSVSRELTKKFEQTVRGTLAEVAAHFAAHEPKGEIVVVLGGRPRREAGADGPAASGRDSADINSMGL
ncbi:16S rRNA (cytidine(1402)-2'-O)-methyltransferase, partial [Alistipes ihumii]